MFCDHVSVDGLMMVMIRMTLIGEYNMMTEPSRVRYGLIDCDQFILRIDPVLNSCSSSRIENTLALVGNGMQIRKQDLKPAEEMPNIKSAPGKPLQFMRD